MQTCPKCGHRRTNSETVPDWQCPNCGIAYAKFRQSHNVPLTSRKSPESSSGSLGKSAGRASLDAWNKVFHWLEQGWGFFIIFAAIMALYPVLNSDDFFDLPVWVHSAFGVAAAVVAYVALVPGPRKNLRRLSTMVGGSYEASSGPFDLGYATVTGSLSGRAFRIRAMPSSHYGGNHAQTIIELGLRGAASRPSAVGTILDGQYFPACSDPSRELLPNRLDPFSRLKVPVKPDRPVEELWDGFVHDSHRLRKAFAKGRLFIGMDEIVWGCYGNTRRPETLEEILHFIVRIASEVEQGSSAWVQTRKDMRVLDYLGGVRGLAVIALFLALVAVGIGAWIVG